MLQKLEVENATAFREEFMERIQEVRKKGGVEELLNAAWKSHHEAFRFLFLQLKIPRMALL